MVGGYKVTTNISTKSALQIGVSPAPRRTPSETQRVTNLASSKIGAKRLEIHFCRETWVNSQQRAIFVYLLSKYDHKSCTPAGAKLTNEYTHRTDKNDPCTVSVTPSQLCTFFRKRTPVISHVGGVSSLPWDCFVPTWVADIDPTRMEQRSEQSVVYGGGRLRVSLYLCPYE